MSRRPARCTQADIKRALSVAQKFGPDVAVDILPDGTIRLCKSRPAGERLETPADDETPEVMF